MKNIRNCVAGPIMVFKGDAYISPKHLYYWRFQYISYIISTHACMHACIYYYDSLTTVRIVCFHYYNPLAENTHLQSRPKAMSGLRQFNSFGNACIYIGFN